MMLSDLLDLIENSGERDDDVDSDYMTSVANSAHNVAAQLESLSCKHYAQQVVHLFALEKLRLCCDLKVASLLEAFSASIRVVYVKLSDCWTSSLYDEASLHGQSNLPLDAFALFDPSSLFAGVCRCD